MTQTFSFEDAGKRVVTPDGDVVGSVVRVESGDAHVRPMPGVLAGYGSWMAGPWNERGVYRLDAGKIDRVTDDEVVIDVAETEASRAERAAKK